MKRILKYKFDVTAAYRFSILLPRAALVLHAAEQREEYFIWALVDEDQPLENKNFLVIGTGAWIENTQEIICHISTIQSRGFVWHIFELI